MEIGFVYLPVTKILYFFYSFPPFFIFCFSSVLYTGMVLELFCLFVYSLSLLL